jgi:4-hydroxy-3-methylbut-2-enyl diphosphate reductase
VTHVRAEWLAGARTVGLSAGASAPDALVDDLVRVLGGLGRIITLEHPVTVEDVRFTMPKELRGDSA